MKLPIEFIPRDAYMPITVSANGNQGSGYIYKNGEVKFNTPYTKGTIVTGEAYIVNEI